MRMIMLGDTVRYPLTGIGRYTVEVFRALPAEGVQPWLWYHGALQAELPGDGPVEERAVALPPLGLKGRLRQKVLAVLSRWAWFLDVLHERIQRREARILSGQVAGAVLHGPNYHVPALPCARVVTVHDLSVFTWADCHPADRVRRLTRVIKTSVKAAHRIITDSEFNRREVIDFFGLPPEKVVAVPLACDARFRPDARLASDIGLPVAGYALWIGTVEPRKNLTVLLSAWEALPEALRVQVPLVIAGGGGWRSADIHAHMQRGEKAGWLRYLGFVPDESLPGLYAGASLFCFPSHYEGFGLPVLEAMASGVPVICSTAACLPEVGGQAVRYADPGSVQDWVREIQSVLTNPAEGERLRALGLARASEFSWARTAALTKAVYEQAQQAFEREQE